MPERSGGAYFPRAPRCVEACCRRETAMSTRQRRGHRGRRQRHPTRTLLPDGYGRAGASILGHVLQLERASVTGIAIQDAQKPGWPHEKLARSG